MRADIRGGPVGVAVTLVAFAVELVLRLRGHVDPFAAVELVEPDPALGPECLKLGLALVETVDRCAHHLALVGELPTLNSSANADLNIVGAMDRQRCSSCIPA
ncbi:MAG TPA: hypothetical protein VH475_08305 [Tepidisphaeraceae bacterium]